MSYKENPKTKGSGIKCCIPQTVPKCPYNCADCFYQSGRSYLEPLNDSIPNMPTAEEAEGCVIRVNDGHDSSFQPDRCMRLTADFPHKFYNTSWPKKLAFFDAPVVLTVNPGKLTDKGWHKVEPIPRQLMMVRFRTNLWNMDNLEQVIEHYASRDIAVIMTWMAYHEIDAIPEDHRQAYVERKRTLNSYFAIRTEVWRDVCMTFDGHPHELWIHSCGKVEGQSGGTACRHCGNCLREYFAATERMKSW
jgi:hypothetical protein